MRELALHMLDLMENSVDAGASRVLVRIEQRRAADTFDIVVEDDGCGFAADACAKLDALATTKPGKQTGLGLHLFREAARTASGDLTLGRSPLGGASVHVRMRLTHPDRLPLGDVAASFGAMACVACNVDFSLELFVDGETETISTGLIRDSQNELKKGLGFDYSAMRQMESRVSNGLKGLGALT